MPFFANVIQWNLRSAFSLYFLFQQCGQKKSLIQRVKPCTSELNVCVDTTLKEGSVEKLRAWEAPRSIHISPPQRPHRQMMSGQQYPATSHGQPIQVCLAIYEAFRQTEAHLITCALKVGFPLFLGPFIASLLLLWSVGQVLRDTLWCAKEKA